MVSLFSPTTAKAVTGANRFWQGVSRWVAGTDRQLKRLRAKAAEINALEPDMEVLVRCRLARQDGRVSGPLDNRRDAR